MSSGVEYRDRIYIRMDILLKLMRYGSLNQTALLSYCGLNFQKHRGLLEELERKGLITRREVFRGKKRISEYRVTEEGVQFCRRVLEPYEAMFPRIRGK
ncbi:MAG: winged helix-turn-helix domain-containing protein [Candidatus Bathyarchaeia archaeon]